MEAPALLPPLFAFAVSLWVSWLLHTSLVPAEGNHTAQHATPCETQDRSQSPIEKETKIRGRSRRKEKCRPGTILHFPCLGVSETRIERKVTWPHKVRLRTLHEARFVKMEVEIAKINRSAASL